MERRIRELAERQDGVLARRQLLHELELSAAAVHGAVGRRELVPLFREVYALGHTQLRPQGWWRAALLAAGPGAVLSHQAAAMARGIIAVPPRSPTRRDGTPALPLHVLVPRRLASQPGLTVHWARQLDRRGWTTHDGIPTTTVERTLVDLADVLEYRALRDVSDAVKRLNAGTLRHCHERLPGRRGHASIRRLLLSMEGGIPRSAFERRLGPFLAAGGLPQPDVRNVKLGRGWVDAVFWRPKVALELDSRAWHARQAQMREDRRRDRELQRLGFTPVRLVWEELEPEWAAETYAELRPLLLTG